jgi:8-hydroxy-5-deazaflavin:NADPH oxidoreductase
MKIGIVGSGNIGGTAGVKWAQQGHEVLFSSRHPEQLGELVAAAGPTASAGSIAEAAAFGEVVLVAIPFGSYTELPAAQLAGSIVIDATNYYPQRDGHIRALDDGSETSSELIAQHLAGARLVKAFNTMYFKTLQNEGRPPGPDRLVIFVAGDDADAKMVVGELIEQLGFTPIDTGSLRDGGRKQQPGSPIYNRPLTAEQAREELVRLSAES